MEVKDKHQNERLQGDEMTYLDRTAGSIAKTTHKEIDIRLAHTAVALSLRACDIVVGHLDCG